MAIMKAFLLLALSGEAWAQATFLDEFRIDSKGALSQTVQKQGEVDSVFLQQKIRACRESDNGSFRPLSAQNFLSHSIFKSVEDVEAYSRSFLEVETIYDRVQDIDSRFRVATVEVQPWSSDYWALRSGGAAKRYMDDEFPDIDSGATWLQVFEYFQAHPAISVAAELLAPAEKYDLLANDDQFTLTQASYAEGKAYHDQFGEVESWMGICHGWAAAAIIEKRPTQTKEVARTDSTEKIRFRPDDIKALLSLKWANGVTVTPDIKAYGTRFVGERCHDKKAEVDPDSGRLVNEACFDLNPGLWHVILTNHIGQTRRSLIMDSNYDYEVWNQPISGYSIAYFNPKTLSYVETLEEAKVSLRDPEFKDKFTKHRNKKIATAVVGVNMTVNFIFETSPRGRDTDDEKYDSVRTVTYHYDLELDRNGRIVGGEWYHNQHPDFLWMPIKDAIVVNEEDFVKPEDAGGLTALARRASAKRIPLNRVLELLK